MMTTPYAPVAGIAVPVAPVTPGYRIFANAKDGQTGWLCWDFASSFIGTSGGRRYVSLFHYCAEKMAMFSDDDETAKKICLVKCEAILADGSFDGSAVDRAHMEITALLQAMGPRLNMANWTSSPIAYERGVLFKFCQNKSLFDLLMATGNDFLIEGSADRYAGIGYTAEQLATAHIPVESYGQNVHGVTLMKVRDQLRQVGWEQRPQWTYLVPEKQQPSFTRNDLPAFSLAPPIAAVVPVATITAPKPVDPLQRALVNSVVAPSHLPTGPGIIDFPLAPPPDLVPGGPMKLPSFDPIPVATITTPAPAPVVAAPVVIPEAPVVVITAPGETVPVVEVPVVVTETPTFEAPAVEQVPEQPKVEANGLDDLFN